MNLKVMIRALVILSVVFLFGCQPDVSLELEAGGEEAARTLQAAEIEPVVSNVVKEKLIRDIGVIKYIGLEGGFYGIIGRRGRYDPINLPREFQQDGLRVRLTGKLLPDYSSFHMWGRMIELISLRTTRCEKKLVMDRGVLHQYMIQGGPWVIEATTDDYQALNLPEKFQIENLNVSFVGVIREDIVIIPALWPLVEILSIEAIGEKPIMVNLGEEFKLPLGKSALTRQKLSVSAVTANQQVLLTFKSVLQDSRCPTGVVCVWQGQAVVLVNVKIGNKDYGDFEMTTLDRPSTINAGAYYIEFFDLAPYPVYGEPTDPDSYVGYFMIDSALETEDISRE